MGKLKKSPDDEPFEVEVIYHMVTEKAILVSDDGKKKHAVWLPLSQIEVVGSYIVGAALKITAPEWLLKKNGLI